MTWTKERREEVLGYCDKATPAPWGTTRHGNIPGVMSSSGCMSLSNLDFTIKARTDLPEAMLEIERLQAELEVRTHNPGFPSRPKHLRKTGVMSAFDSGFESGWKGHPFQSVYVRSDCSIAHVAGYEQGSREAAEEIARLLDAAKESV